MSLEHSPLCLLSLSTVPHFSRLCFLTYTLNRIRRQLIAYVYATFSSSPNLIRTYLNHLIRFLNYRCTNSGLITQKHSILGILGTHVPVHPEHVPIHVAFCWHVLVHVGFWWGVSVHPCTCTGTPSEICPDFSIFVTFDTNSLHTTSIIHITSRIIMEIIQKQLQNTYIGGL